MDDAHLPGDTRVPALAVDVAAGPDVRMMQLRRAVSPW
jgi:hypothetical protein